MKTTYKITEEDKRPFRVVKFEVTTGDVVTQGRIRIPNDGKDVTKLGVKAQHKLIADALEAQKPASLTAEQKEVRKARKAEREKVMAMSKEDRQAYKKEKREARIASKK
jgi:hypothetical protein